MTSKAAEKRYEGIRRVSDEIITKGEVTESGTVQIWTTHDASKIAPLIRDLAPLGRTDRWKAAVEGWALLVEDEAQHGPKNVEWAFLQGSIYAAHAAE